MNNKIVDNIKSGFYRGIGLGFGLLTTGVFAAAAAMNVFMPGDVLDSAKINQNFAIAAPEGAVMAFYLTGCPQGWAPADGTNGTPDLRGMFIRGRDDIGTGAAGNDPGGVRGLGNFQLDAFQGHRHQTLAYHDGGAGHTDSGTIFFGYSNIDSTNPITDGVNGVPRISNETRPKNVSLTYCMRHNL